MKMRIILPSLMAFTLLLSACQALEEGPPEEEGEEMTTTKQTGTLEANDELGGFDLMLASGQKLKVRSLTLDLRKYNHRKVEADGILGSDDIFTIESVAQLSRDDETKTQYQTTELGFQVQYPSVWNAEASEGSVVFVPYKAESSELIDKITVLRFANDDKKTLLDYLNLDSQNKPKDSSDLSTYTAVVIGIDQLPGIKKTSEDGIRIDFYVVRDASVYRISHSAIDAETREKNRNIFFDMVNSFQFIAFTGGTPISETATETTIAAQTETPTPAAETSPSPTPAPEPTPAPTPPPEPEQQQEPITPPPSDLGDGYAWISSRGFGVKMQYPKNWYWEQVGTEIRFSDKPLDESGTIMMKFYQGRPGPEEAMANVECKDFEGSTYCLTSDTSEQSLMSQMLGTLQVYSG